MQQYHSIFQLSGDLRKPPKSPSASRNQSYFVFFAREGLSGGLINVGPLLRGRQGSLKSKRRSADSQFVFLVFLFTAAFSIPLPAQPLSSDLWLVRNHQWLLDLGIGWETQTLFQPYQGGQAQQYYQKAKYTPQFWPARELTEYWKQVSRKEKDNPDGLSTQNWFGFLGQISGAQPDSAKNDFGSTYWMGQVNFRHFFAEWYLRAASRPSALGHFTGHARDIKRFGLNCAEFDQASVGFQNAWLTLSYGRGRQAWGPFGSENLVLSSQSAAYDHISALFRYKKITGAFFTGFLESESVPNSSVIQNRYIAGHGIEYSNRKNLCVALGEVTVYSGPNRRFDWAYLNPLAPHLEIELNDRENLPYDVSNRSNGVWFASLDGMLPQRVRISATYLIDEFQFDKKDREKGRPNATAMRIRLSKGAFYRRSSFTIWTSYERVGTYTFRHESAYSGFVSRNLPLGTPLGSDFDAWQIGMNAILPFSVQFQGMYTISRQGQNNLLDSLYVPYKHFIAVDFPSGNLKKIRTLALKLLYSFYPNLELEANVEHKLFKNRGMKNQTVYYLRLNGYLPLIRTF
jgi:hypothetical protein